jgi:tetratricopeptide (TPR) repeat protein
VERLVYSVDQLATLALEQSRLSVITLKFGNLGNKSARNVRIVVSFAGDAEVAEKQVASSAGPAAAFSDISANKKTLSLTTETLAPTEILTATVLLRGTSIERPSIGFRSSDSVGQLGSLTADREDKGSAPNLWYIIGLAAASAAAAQAAATLAKRRTRLSESLASVFPSRNNTAFLLIQRKLLNQARALLSVSMGEKGASVFELANFGLVEGLDGKPEDAEQYFRLAEWWSKGDRARAVVKFNRATLMLSLNNYAEARAHLSEAFALDRAEISRYCDISAYVQEALLRDPELASLVKAKGRK